MERMYQEFKEIAEFRMVYIKEAHAADSDWSVPYAKEKGITEHDDFQERCATAEMLLADESLTIPCLIDSMDDEVNEAFRAWPDRVFVVRSDGRLAVAGAQGPRGFEPALRETREWLEAFVRDGSEPPLPERAGATADEAGDDEGLRAEEVKADAQTALAIAALVGSWNVTIEMGERIVQAEMTFSLKDHVLSGTWSEGGRTSNLADVEVEADVLRFKRRISDQHILIFDGQVCGDQIIGRFRNGERELIANAVKKSDG